MKRGDRWVGTFRLLGFLLLAVAFLPLGPLFGELRGAGGYVPPAEWLLGLGIFLPLSWLLVRLLPAAGDRSALLASQLLRRPSTGRLLGGGLLILGLVTAGVAVLAFGRKPLLIDSVVQLFQARVFASGRVVAPAPPADGFFVTQHTLLDGNAWYAQYPPGHSALLAVGSAAGAAWLIPVLLTVGTAGALFAFVRRAYGRIEARLTLVLLVLAPFFWFMGASHMNHVSSLFFLALFLAAFARWEDRPTAGRAVLAGLALGGAFLSRPLDAVAVGAVFAGIAVPPLRARREWGSVAGGTAGFLAVAAVFLAFNWATTGDPFLPGYIKLWGESHGLGFHEGPWGEVHTPLAGLRNELLDVALLHALLFEWPIPSLLPVAALFAAGWARPGWDRRLLLAFLAIPAAYFFYWHRDGFLGPRFLYAGLAFVLPLTARGLLAAWRWAGERRLRAAPGLDAVPARGWLASLLLLCFAYSLLYAVPQRFRVYNTGLRSMKVDLLAEARRAGLEEGVVFVAVSWGNRLLARIRALGVPASLAERAYRNVDHCELERLVTAAEAEAGGGRRLAARLEVSLEREWHLAEPALNGDPTMRLAAGRPLDPACAAEVVYDRSGYTVYSPHLLANRPDLSGPFVVARDLRGRNEMLRRNYPGRPAYLYRPGRFIPLEAGGAEAEPGVATGR